MERVCATYDAITYTCHHRLGGNRRLAEQVSVQVLAGLLAKPNVFRYFGLPYSGRIARLAEARLAEAREGRLADVGNWPELLRGLTRLSLEHQEVFVLTCVRGDDDGQLASNLGCDAHTARLRGTAPWNSSASWRHARCRPQPCPRPTITPSRIDDFAVRDPKEATNVPL